MKILVTGGSGFIGSALIRLAIMRGYSVVNLDILTYAACSNNLASISDHPNYTFEQLDVCDRAGLDLVFSKHNPDSVMHLAAESHVDRSIDSPINFLQSNIIGTFNMLEASRKYLATREGFNKFRFHHVSTDEVYGSLNDDPSIKFTETTSYNPRSPYSATKASADHLVRAWYTTYGLPIIITNCSNNYGPYQFPEKLVPVIILNAIAERPLPIYGNGKNIRDWLYVEDHATALLLALENGKVGRSYNIGGENELSNLELVHMLCNILDQLSPRKKGNYDELITFVKDRPGHDARYAINPRRIREELGWSPSITIEQGLKKTAEWYLDNKDFWSQKINPDRILQRSSLET